MRLKREGAARRGRVRNGQTKPQPVFFDERASRHLNFDIVRSSGSMVPLLIPEVLNGRTGAWQAQKRAWLKLGIQSDLGRKRDLLYPRGNSKSEAHRKIQKAGPQTSIFDPVLCQKVYEKLTQPGDLILDPFAGGSVRGIVAAILGRRYVGIELRPEQVEENRGQANRILEDRPKMTLPTPTWIVGDSRNVQTLAPGQHDCIFTCPPYFDLECYSCDSRDLSYMEWKDFLAAYTQIIHSCVGLLKPDGYSCFVVADVEDDNGLFRGLPDSTYRAFEEAGAKFEQESRYYSAPGSASLRAKHRWNTTRQLLARPCQSVLVFRRSPAPEPAAEREQISLFGETEIPTLVDAKPASTKRTPSHRAGAYHLTVNRR